MSIGFPRSVLSGAARGGSSVVRSAMGRRRGLDTGPRDWNEYLIGVEGGGGRKPTTPASTAPVAPAAPDPSKWSTGAGYVGGTPMAPHASTDLGSFMSGSGGPGGYTDKKGNFIPYGYGQSDGPWSGFSTQGALQSAIGGQVEKWQHGLADQADSITGTYDANTHELNDPTGWNYYAQMAHQADQTSDARGAAWKAAEQAMPTYGELSPEAYSAVRANAGPVNPAVFDKTHVGEGTSPLETIYYGGPRIPSAGQRDAVAAGSATNVLGPAVAANPGQPKGSMYDWQNPAMATSGYAGYTMVPGLSQPTSMPTPGHGPTVLDIPGTPAIPGRGPNVAEGPGGVQYDPTADWSKAMGGQKGTFDAINELDATKQAAEQARWQPALNDIERMASMPDNQYYQTVATQAYGVDPNVAAGWYGDQWQADRDLSTTQGEVAMNVAIREANAWDQYNMPYSETLPAAQYAQERAARDKAFFDQTGLTPAEYQAQQRRSDATADDPAYAALDEFTGLDSKAQLEKYNLTLDQVDQVTHGNLSQSFLDAWDALNAAVDPATGQLDEQTAADAMRAAWSVDPLIARVLEAFRPELAGADYLVP